MKYQNIWLLDDREHRRNDFFGKVIGEIFRGSKIHDFHSSWDALENLRRIRPSNIPEIIFFDAFAFMDRTKGFSEFESVIGWLRGNRPDHLPKYVVFISADHGYAAECKELAIESKLLQDGNIYAIGKDELYPASNLIKKRQRSSSGLDKEDGECRAFLNHALGLHLPVTLEELDEYYMQQGLLEAQDVVHFYRSGKMIAVRALELLVKEERWPLSDSSWEHIDDKYVRDVKMGFQRGSGEPRHGYAAFSIDDVLALKREGKEPVLIVDQLDPSWYVHLPQLAGLVVMWSEASGHLEMLAGSYGVSTLITSKTGKDLIEDHKFLQLSQPNESLIRLTTEGAAPRLEFVYGIIDDEARQFHREHGYRDDDRLSKAVDSDQLWDRAVKIEAGDPITLDTSGMQTGLIKDHVPMQAYNFRAYIPHIKSIYRRAAEENCQSAMNFKANIDAINQVSEACWVADGIGLVRTEHFSFTDAASFRALHDIYTDQPNSAEAHATLRERQEAQTIEIFDAIQQSMMGRTDKPAHVVRVRLLDAPPEEFLSQDEMRVLSATIPVHNQRGVQIGLIKPELYQNQLDAIFAGHAAFIQKPVHREEDFSGFSEEMQRELAAEDAAYYGNMKVGIKLEIMVPTVKTLEELQIVKQMAHEAAQRHGFGPKDYKFGIMLETPEAAANIKKLAPHVDFISIGSNDLTSAVTGISRSDVNARKAFIDPKTGQGDPFVTLRADVAKIILGAVREIRRANPNIDVDLCGAHAADLTSLKKLRSAKLTSVSLPPSGRNHHALVADWALDEFKNWRRRERQMARKGLNTPAS